MPTKHIQNSARSLHLIMIDALKIRIKWSDKLNTHSGVTSRCAKNRLGQFWTKSRKWTSEILQNFVARCPQHGGYLTNELRFNDGWVCFTASRLRDSQQNECCNIARRKWSCLTQRSSHRFCCLFNVAYKKYSSTNHGQKLSTLQSMLNYIKFQSGSYWNVSFWALA